MNGKWMQRLGAIAVGAVWLLLTTAPVVQAQNWLHPD